MSSRRCSRCSTDKPLEHFYKHPSGLDGRMPQCKDCHKLAMKDLRSGPNGDAVRARDRARDRSKPERVIARRDYLRRLRITDAGRVRVYQQRWTDKHPEAKAAHTKVNNAVRDGRLTKSPCEKCGDTTVQAHHDDYSQPMSVRWLCVVCHKAEHRKYKDCP